MDSTHPLGQKKLALSQWRSNGFVSPVGARSPCLLNKLTNSKRSLCLPLTSASWLQQDIDWRPTDTSASNKKLPTEDLIIWTIWNFDLLVGAISWTWNVIFTNFVPFICKLCEHSEPFLLPNFDELISSTISTCKFPSVTSEQERAHNRQLIIYAKAQSLTQTLGLVANRWIWFIACNSTRARTFRWLFSGFRLFIRT